MAKDKSTKKTMIDFTGVEARKMIPEGDHELKVVEATLEDGEEHPYIAWVMEVQKGPAKGGKLYDNTSLSPKALWRLRTLLEAMGIDVPEGKMAVDLKEWVDEGGTFIGTVEHERYEGKNKPRLVDVFPADATEEDTGDGEEETKPAGGKSSKKEEPEAEDEEEPDFDEMDEDELEEFVDDKDLDVDLDEHKKLSKKRAAVKEAWEARDKDGGDGKEDEGGEDDAPTAEAISEMGTKDLQAIVAKYRLGIELDGSTKTKRRAVLKALKAKKIIKD